MGDSVINNSVNKLQSRTNAQENRLINLDDAVGKIVNYAVPLEEGEYRKTGWFDTARFKEIYTDQLVCNELSSLSDMRFKKNIVRIGESLERIKKLRGVTFDWIDEGKKTKGFKKGSKSLGVIAQELEEVFPELVITDKNGFKTVCYEKLPAVLIEGIKELSDKLMIMEFEIDKLFLNESRNDKASEKLLGELKNFQKENGNEYYFNKMKIIENKYYSNFLKFAKQYEELENKNKINIKNLSKIKGIIDRKESYLLSAIDQKDLEIKDLKNKYNDLEDILYKIKKQIADRDDKPISQLLGGEKNKTFFEKNKQKILIVLILISIIILVLCFKSKIF